MQIDNLFNAKGGGLADVVGRMMEYSTLASKGEETDSHAPNACDELKRRAKKCMMDALKLLDDDGSELLAAAKLQEALDILGDP